MTQSHGKSMSTSGSNFLQPKAATTSSAKGDSPPALEPQEILASRRLFEKIGLPPMAGAERPVPEENIFAPPDDGKTEEVSTSTPVEPVVQEIKEKEKEREKRYDIPFHEHERSLLSQLSDFTKSTYFKPFENPRSKRSLTAADGATVVEELAQDFSTRTLTTRKDGTAEQVRDRLGRLVYEKFQEREKWTARFLSYHDQDGKKSPFVYSLKSLSSDGRFREVQYSKLGQIESEKETLYDLKLAL